MSSCGTVWLHTHFCTNGDVKARSVHGALRRRAVTLPSLKETDRTSSRLCCRPPRVITAWESQGSPLTPASCCKPRNTSHSAPAQMHGGLRVRLQALQPVQTHVLLHILLRARPLTCPVASVALALRSVCVNSVRSEMTVIRSVFHFFRHDDQSTARLGRFAQDPELLRPRHLMLPLRSRGSVQPRTACSFHCLQFPLPAVSTALGASCAATGAVS